MSDLPDNDESWSCRDEQEEQNAEEAFSQAAMAIEAGQSVEQALGAGDLAKMPEHLKRKIRVRLQQLAQEKIHKEHEMARQTREKVQKNKSGVSRLFSLGMLSNVISRETIERVQQLFSQQPHLKQELNRQGQTMIKSGMEMAETANKMPTAPSSSINVSQRKNKEQYR